MRHVDPSKLSQKGLQDIYSIFSSPKFLMPFLFRPELKYFPWSIFVSYAFNAFTQKHSDI